MHTKLTLTIEEDIVSLAKNYAKKQGESLSGLIEKYLKSILSTDVQNDKITPIVKSLKGSIQVPHEFEYKKELSKRHI